MTHGKIYRNNTLFVKTRKSMSDAKKWKGTGRLDTGPVEEMDY